MRETTNALLSLKTEPSPPEEFEKLLENINFPFEIVFEKIGGKFLLTSDGFDEYATSVGFIDCGNLELTRAFFDCMRDGDKIDRIKFIKGTKPKGADKINQEYTKEIIEIKPSPVPNVEPKFPEFKTVKDEPKFKAIDPKDEEPKENDLSAKATG